MTETEIEFEHIDPMAKSGEYYSKDEPSPYFHLTADGMDKSLGWLQKKDEIVIDKPSIRVEFNYPLRDEHIIELFPCDGKKHFTRGTLAQTIALKYQQIYREEDESTQLKVETVYERTNGAFALVNRAETNGVWGIWGHVLGDLDLHTVSYDEEKDVYTLGIDS